VSTQDIFLHPIAIGFYLGSVLTVIAAYNYIRLKGELTRFRRHLSDKLEIEAETMKKLKQEQETLRRENESLRVKVNALNDVPDRKVMRDLEIYARAEKRMLINVPGFAPAWETAKSEAHGELVDEESGKSTPKKIFARLFGGGGGGEKVALPPREDPSRVASVDGETTARVTNESGADR
jgi:cell division protein FtsB